MPRDLSPDFPEADLPEQPCIVRGPTLQSKHTSQQDLMKQHEQLETLTKDYDLTLELIICLGEFLQALREFDQNNRISFLDALFTPGIDAWSSTAEVAKLLNETEFQTLKKWTQESTHTAAISNIQKAILWYLTGAIEPKRDQRYEGIKDYIDAGNLLPTSPLSSMRELFSSSVEPSSPCLR